MTESEDDIETHETDNILSDRSFREEDESKAHEAFASEQWALAIVYYESVDNLSQDGKISLGKAYEQVGEIDEALQVWQLAVEDQNPPIELYGLLKKGLVETGQYYQAMEWLQKGIASDPENIELKSEAIFLEAVISPEEALKTYQQWQTDNAVGIQSLVAFIQSVEQVKVEADPVYQKILLGRALGRERQWQLAEHCFLKAVEAAPDYAEAWAFLGEAQLQLEKDGWLALNRAEELAPDSPVVLSLVGYHWRLLEQPKEALPYIQRVAALEPNEPVWQIELAEVLSEIGYLSEALVHYQNAVTLAPNQSHWWQLLAQFCVYYDIEVREIALPAAREVMRLAPEEAESLDLMGLVLLKLGDVHTSERFLQSALEKDPEFTGAHLHLGQLYLFDGRMKLAETYLTTAVSLAGPESEINALAKRLLDYNFPH